MTHRWRRPETPGRRAGEPGWETPLDNRRDASIVAADMTGLPSTISLRILRLLLPA